MKNYLQLIINLVLFKRESILEKIAVDAPEWAERLQYNIVQVYIMEHQNVPKI